MNIYLFLSLTVLLTLVVCGISLSISLWMAAQYQRRITIVIVHAIISIAAGTVIPLAFWYLTFRESGTVHGSHNAIMLFPFVGIVVVACGIASAAKGASWIVRNNNPRRITVTDTPTSDQK